MRSDAYRAEWAQISSGPIPCQAKDEFKIRSGQHPLAYVDDDCITGILPNG